MVIALQALGCVLLLVLIFLAVELLSFIRELRGRVSPLLLEVSEAVEETQNVLERTCVLLDGVNGSLENVKRFLQRKKTPLTVAFGVLRNVLPLISVLSKLKRR